MIKSQLFRTGGAWYGLLRQDTSALCVRPVAFAGEQETKFVMIGAVGASSTDIHEAIVALSRSVAGRSRIYSPNC